MTSCRWAYENGDLRVWVCGIWEVSWPNFWEGGVDDILNLLLSVCFLFFFFGPFNVVIGVWSWCILG